MKREDGVLLQRWSRQELRVHEVTHGGRPAIRLVQWRKRDSTDGICRYCGSPFDGTLTATAQRELHAYLTARLNAHATPEKPTPGPWPPEEGDVWKHAPSGLTAFDGTEWTLTEVDRTGGWFARCGNRLTLFGSAAFADGTLTFVRRGDAR